MKVFAIGMVCEIGNNSFVHPWQLEHPPGTVTSDEWLIRPILRGGLGGLEEKDEINKNGAFKCEKVAKSYRPSLPPPPPPPPPPLLPPQPPLLLVSPELWPSGFVNGSINDCMLFQEKNKAIRLGGSKLQSRKNTHKNLIAVKKPRNIAKIRENDHGWRS